jgi:hypothetical protein
MMASGYSPEEFAGRFAHGILCFSMDGYRIVIPVLPLLAGCFGWVLLELVRGAHVILHSLLPAPGIPTVATAALWPVSALIESFFSIVKHEAAHKIAKEVEHVT